MNGKYEILKENYCTAEKISSDPECYEWAKSHPNSIARHYFCQQQYQDPMCTGIESFEDIGNTGEKPFLSWFMMFMLLVVLSITIVVLNILRKSRSAEKYYDADR